MLLHLFAPLNIYKLHQVFSTVLPPPWAKVALPPPLPFEILAICLTK